MHLAPDATHKERLRALEGPSAQKGSKMRELLGGTEENSVFLTRGRPLRHINGFLLIWLPNILFIPPAHHSGPKLHAVQSDCKNIQAGISKNS